MIIYNIIYARNLYFCLKIHFIYKTEELILKYIVFCRVLINLQNFLYVEYILRIIDKIQCCRLFVESELKGCLEVSIGYC